MTTDNRKETDQSRRTTFDQWYDEHVKHMNLADFKPWLGEAWVAGANAENEACAEVCEDHFSSDGHWCATAIRARGEK